MDFDSYQSEAQKTDEAKKSTISLYGLSGEVGSIFSLFKKRLRDNPPFQKFQDELKEELGDLLWYISSIASIHKISLSEIAAKNLAKSRSLFDEGEITHFDSEFKPEERLPRSLTVEFQLDPKTKRSEMIINGQRVGDPLSDNTDEEDHYRFHDIFHLSFMAFLGWSPVMRRLLNTKRKSDPKVDENEDGARAAITEEAISAIVFSVAEDNDFFREIRSIPVSLLKTIGSLAGKFEVRTCTFKQWQHAIWHGCHIYRELVANQGGTVELDLNEPAIRYVACPIDGG
ncbi:nucleoside triphosphate pyrophosphohydrolase family protein [Bradyrhizobium sp. Gha]|uniref:nucleoside triphosphate pyrophosphohydrolase family protein n=1 Tax=Bradyrhizobium sp. Gha TaxID=1855318 RepID=UPI0008E871E1|nr:nucleoside triphosphate pyrophosphohydrolase family protein [Bradyrhizobium sp. Gha]SFJ06702.1 MazG nucleotide pyrophosphohydrolase domain-containing protein [Bradyrhizobium sp. Gha]